MFVAMTTLLSPPGAMAPVLTAFALVTRRPYCPGRPKKFCFATPSLAPTVLTARLSEVKQSFFGLPGQYGRRVTRANSIFTVHDEDQILEIFHSYLY